MKKRKISAVDGYVGNRVRLMRNALNISQAELAISLKTSVRNLNKMENGTKRISPDCMVQLTQLFGVEAAYFFDGLDDEYNKRPPE